MTYPNGRTISYSYASGLDDKLSRASALSDEVLNGFNPTAQKAIYYTRGALSATDREWLRALPNTLEKDRFQLVHNAPGDPRGCEQYLLTADDAQAAFARAARPWVLGGHTHKPIVFFRGPTIEFSRDAHCRLEPGVPALVNVGSAGQPRDGDPRACWVVLDTRSGELEFRRVVYDWNAAATKMQQAGLPELLADRLKTGK